MINSLLSHEKMPEGTREKGNMVFACVRVDNMPLLLLLHGEMAKASNIGDQARCGAAGY
jgi:hypothetical protein